MKTARTFDMTTGNVEKNLLVFCMPLFFGQLFNQMYNMVDSLIVGKFVSADALAATGACSSLNFLFFAMSLGLSNGVGIIIAQYFGAGNEEGIRKTIANAFFVLIGASLLATLICTLVAERLLRFLNTPEEIIKDAVIYLVTTAAGIVFLALYNVVSAVLRALGDSKTPLVFLIISSFLNVFMDIFFVLTVKWGVFGVAFATVISQFAAAVICWAYALKKVEYFKFRKEYFKPDKRIIGHIFKLGVPMALQSSMISISLIILQSVVNTFGATVMAAYTISAKIDNLVSQFYSALAMALTTYAGQNKGAGRNDRIKEGLIKGSLIVFIYNLLIIPLCFFFSRQISSFFVSDAGVIEYGATALRITAVLYFFLAMIYIPRGVLNGCGDAAFSMINGGTEVVCRIVFSHLFTVIPFIGVWGIWWAAGATWLVTSVVCVIRFACGRWKKIKVE